MTKKLFVFISFFFLVGCNDDIAHIQHINVKQHLATTRAQYTDSLVMDDVEKLLLLGLDTTNLLIRDSYYIADGVCVPKSILDGQLQQSRISQNNSISSHYHNVYYRLPSSSVSNSLYQCFVDAITTWTTYSSSSGLNISYGSQATTNKAYFQINLEVSSSYQVDDPLVFPIFESTQQYAPYKNIVINKNSSLWNQVASNSTQFTYLVMHAIGESLKFDSIDYYDGVDRSIMLSEELLATEPELWDGLSYNDINGINEAFPISPVPVFTYTWTPSLESTTAQRNILQKNTEYTLAISSSGTCCQSVGTEFHIKVMQNDAIASNVTGSHISGTDSFSITFEESGHYTLTVWVNDSDVKELHKQTIDLYVVENEFSVVTPANVGLNNAITLQYQYYHPDHQNITYEFSVEEVMFNDEEETSPSITEQTNGNRYTITPQKYGCFYIDAIVKSNGVEVDHKYCNLTVLNDMGTNVRMVYDVAASGVRPYSMTDTYVNNYYFDIIQERPLGNNARTAYFFEYETETQSWNEAPTRVVCRYWFLDYNLIIFDENETEKRSMLEMVQHGEMISYRDAYYQYYTGNLYCPVNGLWFVNNKDILTLPMHRVFVDIENYTENPIISDIELNIVQVN